MRKSLRTTSWAYEEIMEEGCEEERQQRLKDLRQVLMTFVQAHFPNVADLAKQQADAANDPEQLQSLCIKLLTTQTEEQARQILLETKGNAS